VIIIFVVVCACGSESNHFLIYIFYFTLRRVTRSAAWRSVRAEILSTSLCKAGSEGTGAGVEPGEGDGGGGDADVEVVASAVAVASARTRIHPRVLRAETLCGMSKIASDITRNGRNWHWIFAYH
jgi:hypothetical protein